MENNNILNIPKEKFELAHIDEKHDAKFDTKPIGYFKDAFNRFKKNKASIVAMIIIILLLLYALITPVFSTYSVSYNDIYFRLTLPKNPISIALGLDFWDGCSKKEQTEQTFLYEYAKGVETGHNSIKNQEYTTSVRNGVTYYKYRLDSYQSTGVIENNYSYDEYMSIQKYQNETGIQVIYPACTPSMKPVTAQDKQNGNFWYKTYTKDGKTCALLDENGNYENIYLKYNGNDEYNSIRIEGGEPLYNYAVKSQTGYTLRVNYYEYYIYYHSYVLNDGITKPAFFFGTTNFGQDILTCLASGALFSFALAIAVCLVNFTVGAIYGAIEGYYGGKIDLVMERISDILSAIPFMVVITLLQHHMGASSSLPALLISFFVTGWIGMASSVRMQFYRYKNQEYVLAARTLGARDRRIMFKHIFPNSLGTLITGSVLSIPGVIFTESSLSYLGIINLSTGSVTSVGTLLANAAGNLLAAPHTLLFPCLFISLLMLSFNLFGNGLRDAFNPLLRGAED